MIGRTAWKLSWVDRLAVWLQLVGSSEVLEDYNLAEKVTGIHFEKLADNPDSLSKPVNIYCKT